MSSESNKKTAYNVAGTVIGALLASVSIFLVIQGMQQDTPQEHSRLITYNN